MFLNIHTHIPEGVGSIFNVVIEKDAVPLHKPYSIGIHPWYIGEETKMLQALEIELNHNAPYCLFIGECGLDKLKGANELLQLQVFKSQILLSERFEKPMLIHCVKGYAEIQQLKKELHPHQAWVIHGFNKNKQLANQLIKQGFYLSFGAHLLTSTKLQDALLHTPLDFVFFETDAQTKVTILEIYTFAAELLGIELDFLKNKIEENLWTITGWKGQSS